MKKVFLLLTPLQIIYIAVAIMTAVSVAAYSHTPERTNQNAAPSNQNGMQYQQPTTIQNQIPSTSAIPTDYPSTPTQVPVISAKVECIGGTVKVCDAGYCECVRE